MVKGGDGALMTLSQVEEQIIKEQPEPVREQRTLLTVNNVERTFQVGGTPLHVLKGIKMELKESQLVMLRGRSGSGKTTLLNCLGGLDTPSKGEIWFKDFPIHSMNDDQRTIVRRKGDGVYFSGLCTMPLLSAWENVELTLRMAGVPSSTWKTRVEECLTLVGLEKRMHHRPFELSGGEQQRVAIAKAIAHRPYCCWQMNLQPS